MTPAHGWSLRHQYIYNCTDIDTYIYIYTHYILYTIGLFEHVRAVSAKKQTSVEWGSASELSTHFFHGDQGSTDPPNSAIVYIEAGFQNRGCVLVLSPTGSRADANLPH